MNKHRTLLHGLCLIVVFLAASPASAFDDERKGFTLGLGAGFSPMARLRGDDDGVQLKEDAMGLAGGLSVGMGLGGHDVMSFEFNAAAISSDLYGDRSHQSFTGFAWTHYFGSPGRAFFGTLGFGDYQYDWQGSRHYICWGNECDPPPRLPGRRDRQGYLAGAGYEFDLHWQVGAYASWCSPEYEGDFFMAHVSLLLQYTWF